MSKKFNFRTRNRGDLFLVNGLHEDRKMQGTIKTTYDRPAFALHYVNTSCQHVAARRIACHQRLPHPSALDMTDAEYMFGLVMTPHVPRSALAFAYWFAGEAERHWA